MYNRDLQRLSAALLSLAISLQLMTPLLFSAEPEAKLPSCCRRDGKHGCSMSKSGAGSAVPDQPAVSGIKARCPLFPVGKSTPGSERIATVPALATSAIPRWISIERPERGQPRRQSTSIRVTAERGPPSHAA